jgi:hypothetical protein
MECAMTMEDSLRRARFSGPTWYYDEDGDCIEFVSASDRFYAERKDEWVSAYYSYETGQLVGSMIKDVSKLVDSFPGFRNIEVRDGRVRLSHLYQLSGWTCQRKDGENAEVYARLIETAEKSAAEVTLCGV